MNSPKNNTGDKYIRLLTAKGVHRFLNGTCGYNQILQAMNEGSIRCTNTKRKKTTEKAVNDWIAKSMFERERELQIEQEKLLKKANSKSTITKSEFERIKNRVLNKDNNSRNN